MDDIAKMVRDHDKQLTTISTQLDTISESLKVTVAATSELQKSVNNMQATKAQPVHKYLPHITGLGVVVTMLGASIIYVATNGLTPKFEQIRADINQLEAQYIRKIHAMDKRLALMEYRLQSK